MREQHYRIVCMAAIVFAGHSIARAESTDVPNVAGVTPTNLWRCEDNAECKALADERPNYLSYEGRVVKVVDGDTLRVRVHLWPGFEGEFLVRARGVDVPAADGRAKCPAEQKLGLAAKRSIQRKFETGTWVRVSNVEHGKFAERVIADVERWHTNHFSSMADELLRSDRWAVAYDGTGERHDWCTVQVLEPANDN